jgi:hemolysin activation/secretion protein
MTTSTHAKHRASTLSTVRLRMTALALILAAAGYFTYAVTEAEEAAAKREAKAAQKSAADANRLLEDLQGKLAKAMRDEAKAKTDLATAEAELKGEQVDGAAPKRGLFGRKSPAERVREAREGLQQAQFRVKELRAAISRTKAQLLAAEQQNDVEQTAASRKTLAELEGELQEAVSEESKLANELKKAESKMASQSAPGTKPGLLSTLFGGGGPAQRAVRLRAKLAEVQARIQRLKGELSSAESGSKDANERAATAGEMANKLSAQRQEQDVARQQEKADEVQMAQLFQQRREEYAKARQLADEIAAQLERNQQKEQEIEKDYLEALKRARVATRETSEAPSATERQAAEARMRAAEADAGALYKDLTRVRDAISTGKRKAEEAERAAEEASKRLKEAQEQYAPYAAAKRAATERRGNEERARQAAADAENRARDAQSAALGSEKERQRLQADATKKASTTELARTENQRAQSSVDHLVKQIAKEEAKLKDLEDRAIRVKSELSAAVDLATRAQDSRTRRNATNRMREAQEDAISAREDIRGQREKIENLKQGLQDAQAHKARTSSALQSAETAHAPVAEAIAELQREYQEQETYRAKAEAERKAALSREREQRKLLKEDEANLLAAQKLAETIVLQERQRADAAERARMDALQRAAAVREALTQRASKEVLLARAELEQEELAAQKAEQERQRAEAERLERVASAQRAAAEAAAKAAAAERAAAERAEAKRLAAARKEKEQAERAEHEREAKAEVERKRREAQAAARQRAEIAERAAREKAELQARGTDAARLKAEQERAAAERAELLADEKRAAERAQAQSAKILARAQEAERNDADRAREQAAQAKRAQAERAELLAEEQKSAQRAAELTAAANAAAKARAMTEAERADFQREAEQKQREAAKAARERAKRVKEDAEQLAKMQARQERIERERAKREGAATAVAAAVSGEREATARAEEPKAPPVSLAQITEHQEGIAERAAKAQADREAAESAAQNSAAAAAAQEAERLARQRAKESDLARQQQEREALAAARRQADDESRRASAAGSRDEAKRMEIERAELDRVHTERSAHETEMERKSERDLNAAQKEFNIVQIEANRKETELINVQRAIRELEQREREAKLLYVQKTQEASGATGQQDWNASLIEVRAAERNANEIMQELKRYRFDEAKAQIEANQSRSHLELARVRLNEAKKTYALYEEANKARRERMAIGATAIEEIKTKIDKGKVVAGVAGPGEISYQGPWPPEGGEALPASARAPKQGGNKYDISAVVVTGDRDPVYGLATWQDYENDALYAPMSDSDIESFRQRLLKDLQDDGYVFATVSVYKNSLRFGFLKFRVHVGKKGEVTVVGNRWYTARQILKATSWETGRRFNYRNLYAKLFDFNTKPDIQLDTKLQPKVDEFGNRIVDVEINVEDSFPLHVALTLSNTGTKESNDWRLRGTLQHLNLTRRNDVLSVDWITDPQDLGAVNALSTSYYYPWEDGRGVTLYAGYSQSELNDVAPELDVFGKGWYYGAQYSKVLKDTEEYTIDATAGWLYQYSERQNELSNTSFGQDDLTLSMPSLTIGYSSKTFDKYGGRNYVSNTLQANFAGKFGSSRRDKFTAQSALAEGDFLIDRFSFARFQKLFSGENEPGKWSAMIRLDGQLADDELIPAVKKGMGGANNVRGYEEREVSGDSGVTGSIELRTPLVDNFIPGLKRSKEYRERNPDDWMMHRLQLIAFYDFGKVSNANPVAGESKDEAFSSLGAGFRLGLTKYSQIKFDYGFPLAKTEESSSGLGHLSLQVQW